MNFRKLALIEAEKLLKAPVFWVAPLVLALYLALMLFGYEVYAAKNGVAAGARPLRGQMTGSAVVSFYSAVKRMALNFVPFHSGVSSGIRELGKEQKGAEVPIEEQRAVAGKMEKFNFWGTFFKNLLHPKPLPVPGCDCPCKQGESKPDQSAPPRPGAAQTGLLDLFVTDAYAEGTNSARVLEGTPPVTKPEDSFMERLQERLSWLTESVPLEDRLIDRERFNGLRFTYLSLHFAFVFVFPLIAVSVAAQLFASELSHGTMRTSLLRPITRTRLLLAKVGVLAGYLLLLILVFSIVTLFVGILFCGYGNLFLDSEVLGNKGRVAMILGDGAVLLFLLSAPVAAVSFLPLAVFAMLLSDLKPEPSFVIGVSSIVYLILFTLGGLPLFEEIRFLFFTTYMDGWRLLFESPAAVAALVEKLVVLILMAAGVLLYVNVRFVKRDIFE